MLKAVLHVSDIDRWPVAIANARNLKKLHPDAAIEIYANSAGVDNYVNMPDKHMATLKDLFDDGIGLFACANTLAAKNIPQNQLPDFVTVVPAAIEALVEKQAEGFSYIKP